MISAYSAMQTKFNRNFAEFQEALYLCIFCHLCKWSFAFCLGELVPGLWYE